MSTTRIVTVNCDAKRPGCIIWDSDGTGHTAREARADARRVGWLIRPRRDVCPSCRRTETHERTDR